MAEPEQKEAHDHRGRDRSRNQVEEYPWSAYYIHSFGYSIAHHRTINENDSNDIDRYHSFTAFSVPGILSDNPHNKPFISN